MGSPRQDGICRELINQVSKYFLDCEIKVYDSYKLSPAPCTDCKWCEYHEGCSNKDLDVFFEDFEDADYIAFFTPVYNNFFPAPTKAILDRFQRYYNARFKRGANPPVKKPKRVGAVIASGSNARQSADYMYNSLKQSFAPLGSEVCSRYYIPNTDMGRYTFNMTELQKFVHQLKQNNHLLVNGRWVQLVALEGIKGSHLTAFSFIINNLYIIYCLLKFSML